MNNTPEPTSDTLHRPKTSLLIWRKLYGKWYVTYLEGFLFSSPNLTVMETLSLGQRIKSTAKRVVKILLTSIIIIGIGVCSFLYWGVYDEGVRAGTILRISKKGMLFKTYEGQLNLETFGALKGANPIMEAFDFSVETSEEEVLKQLQEVALSGERVNLHYIKRYVTFPWRGDTKYFIVKVERSGK